ncbi:MAG: 50S ribosomal protein L10, partial [Syntrophobacterales bacterium]
MNRQEKEAMVDELHEKLERSKATILTDYRGLKVTEITELRHKLKEAGIEYRVVKNSLTRRAVRDTAASVL